MKKFILFPLLACGAASPELAQAQSGYASYCNATSVSPTYNTGTFAPLTCDTNGQLKVSGILAATAASGFPSLSSGASSPLYVDLSGRLYTQTYQAGTWAITLNSGSNTIGSVSVVSALPAGGNSIGFVTLAASTSGGATPYHLLSAANLNATSVKTAAGTLESLFVLSTNSTTAYLKLYNTNGAPSCTGNSVVQTFPIIQNVAVNPHFPVGMSFNSGIGLCITGGQSDTDATSATTGITVSLTYQ